MRFEASIDIAATPSRVWQVYSDVERWPEWTASVTSVDLLDPGPLRVGSRARIRQPRLPTTVWIVTAVDEGRSFVWEAGGPGVRSVGRHLVEAQGLGARATAVLEQGGPLGGLLGRLTKGLTDRYLGLETAGLKAQSESA